MATMSVPCFDVGLDCRFPAGSAHTCTVCGWSECASTPTFSCPEMVATPGASCAECLAHEDDSDGVPVETDDQTALPVELQTVRIDTRPTAELAHEWAARLDSREAA